MQHAIGQEWPIPFYQGAFIYIGFKLYRRQKRNRIKKKMKEQVEKTYKKLAPTTARGRG